MAYKAEHVVDLGSEFVLSATITPATHSDAETLVDSVAQAQMNLDAAGSEAKIEEAVGQRLSQTRHVGVGGRLGFSHLYS